MSASETLEILSGISLFCGCKEETLEKLCCGKISKYRSGDIIYSPACDEKKLIILLDGKAEVFSLDSQKKMLLRNFTAGGVVGIANLFSDSPFVSNVVAQKGCVTLEISKANTFGDICQMLGDYGVVNNPHIFNVYVLSKGRENAVDEFFGEITLNSNMSYREILALFI